MLATGLLRPTYGLYSTSTPVADASPPASYYALFSWRRCSCSPPPTLALLGSLRPYPLAMLAVVHTTGIALTPSLGLLGRAVLPSSPR